MMSGDPLPMVLAVEVQAVEVQVVNPIASAPPPEKVLAEMTDELHARMLQDGLTPEDQRKLFDDGINIVEMYDKIPDAEFSISGIDIKAGRQRWCFIIVVLFLVIFALLCILLVVIGRWG